MMFQYRDDLPKLPESMIELLFVNVENDSWHNSDNYRWYPCHEQVKQWLRENIKPIVPFNKIGLQEMVGEILPHKDTGRTYALNYLLTTGSGILSHYTQTTGNYTGGFVTLNNVVETSVVDIEPFRWHIICTSELHGVSNIQSPRRAITINVV